MLRTVEETANELNVSKTTIYNKLKLNEYKELLVKKQGKSMLDDVLFKLIEDSLKVETKVENEEAESESTEEVATDSTVLINLNHELIETLLEQLKEKDKQIEGLHKLIETNQELIKNNQILLKNEQEKRAEPLQLSEHFTEIDNRLQMLQEKMEEKRQEKKGFLNKIFK